MDSIHEVEERRHQILEELRGIRSLRRGTINEQFLKDPRDATKLRGPYYVLSRREGGKTVSRRLKRGEDLEQAQRDVAEHKRFAGLCQELEQLTERLGELVRHEGGQEKKRQRRSNEIAS